MIFGVLDRDTAPPEPERMAAWLDTPRHGLEAHLAAPITMASAAQRAGPEAAAPACEGGIVAVAEGHLSEREALCRELALAPEASLSRIVLELYRRHGSDFAVRAPGRLACAVFDPTKSRLVLARDALGLAPLFFTARGARLAFASRLATLVRSGEVPFAIDPRALARYLVFDYNPGLASLVAGIERVPPGGRVIADPAGHRRDRWWRLSYADPLRQPEAEIVAELRGRLERAVAGQLEPVAAPGVFVSGGLDSSTVLGLLRRLRPGDALRAYSYSCKSAGFDESHYARLMAESVGAEHREVVYEAQHVLAMPRVTSEMDEPFCDVGINLATWLLGEAASERDARVLTGDGGDELFAGHPVYEADKVGRLVDAVPVALRRPVLRFMAALPDSDRKKDLRVKLKRFGESAGLPPGLLSHRWRTYYTPAELAELFTPDFLSACEPDAAYDDVLEVNALADGPDLLSRSLYSDYHTVVDFYLRRNDLIRRFGVEVRVPLLDRDLVEWCARIPSKLKVRGWFDAKYVLRSAARGLLPDAILDREDKLGHSIPLKNWLREHAEVRGFVLSLLDGRTLRDRGWFQPSAVKKLVDDHLARRRNNSHRIWALAVLEMWLRSHERGR